MKGPALRERRAANVVVIYMIFLVAFQVFLITVAVEAFITVQKGLAWATAIVSVVLAASVGLFIRYLRH